MKVSFRRIAKAMSQNLHKFFFFSRLFLLLIIRICGITCCLQISQVIAIERTYRKRERERTQLMEQQFKTAKKKSTEIANNLPRANSILFLPAKRPFDGSLNPFFHSLRQARHGLYFPLTLALFSWLISSPVPPSTREEAEKKLHFNFTDGTHTQAITVVLLYSTSYPTSARLCLF